MDPGCRNQLRIMHAKIVSISAMSNYRELILADLGQFDETAKWDTQIFFKYLSIRSQKDKSSGVQAAGNLQFQG